MFSTMGSIFEMCSCQNNTIQLKMAQFLRAFFLRARIRSFYLSNLSKELPSQNCKLCFSNPNRPKQYTIQTTCLLYYCRPVVRVLFATGETLNLHNLVILMKATKHVEREQIKISHWLNKISRAYFTG